VSFSLGAYGDSSELSAVPISFKLDLGVGNGDNCSKQSIDLEVMNVFNFGVLTSGLTHNNEVAMIMGDRPWVVNLDEAKPKYKCEECGIYMNMWSLYVAHHYKCSGGKPFKCPKCPGRFPVNYALQMHLRRHNKAGQNKPLHCEKCGAVFMKISSLEKHRKTHLVIRSYRCPYCGQDFNDQKSLEEHQVEKHDEEEMKEHRCDMCSSIFDSLKSLRMHKACHDRQMLFSCPECGLTFFTKAGLFKHEKNIHVQQYASAMTQTSTAGTALTCLDCGSILDDNIQLSNHLVSYCDRRSFLCQECGELYTGRKVFKEHARSHQAKRYSCSMCDATFDAFRTFVNHICVHGGSRPFKCKYCTAAFNQQSHLQLHISNHRKDAKYTCVHCDSLFNTKAALRRHGDKNLLTKGTDENANACQSCDETFATHCSLLSHQENVHPLKTSSRKRKKCMRLRWIAKKQRVEAPQEIQYVVNAEDLAQHAAALGVGQDQIFIQDGDHTVAPSSILQYLAKEIQEGGGGGGGQLIIQTSDGHQATIDTSSGHYREILQSQGYDPATLLAAAQHIEATAADQSAVEHHHHQSALHGVDQSMLMQQQGEAVFSMEGMQGQAQHLMTEEGNQVLETGEYIREEEGKGEEEGEGEELQFMEASEEIQQLCVSQGMIQEQSDSGPVVIYTVELPAGRTSLSEEDLQMLANKLGIQM